ncbi:hypothetical protein PR202_gb28293 [Eleusine coracana subsp. coracana]|uniref:DNA repair protein REV1 n=1 Tax=Eleusine coracana subsp. coracana TaxID=191504 RepID=A0AAV5FW01_ELECO|nr:hypothetical protein PR202_gb28293 [Eleusine coracana subsp. coracana]
MSSTSSGRRAPPAGAATSPGHKRARDDTSASPCDPDSASAKNTRSGFSSSPFADFGSYMAAKNSKLAAQFDADASTSGADSGGLFAGVSIFVDGFTVPSSQELKEIMLNNGGRFVNYFSRHTVTHIVCSHLPDSKMKNLRAFSKGLPVVKPAWVVDSMAENRLLNCSPYQISQHSSSSRKQTKLSAFFSEKHNGMQSNLSDDISLQSSFVQEGSQCQIGDIQTSSVQEGSQCQGGGCENDGSLSYKDSPNDSLSIDDQKASSLEERFNEGIKAGMFVRDAKARCAHLVIVPYNFSAYEEVADQFYGTLHKYCNKVQVDDYLNSLPIKALPGIGHTVSAKLNSKEIEYCSQLCNISKDALHKDFGKKTGDLLWNYCRGVDHSTVGAVQAEHFLTNLCKEVSLRLQGCGVQGRTITLKIAGATDSFVTLQRIAKQLFAAYHADVKEVRGVGLTVTKLEHADLVRGASQGNMIESWLTSSPKIKKQGREKICFRENVDVAGAASHSSEVNPRSDRSTGVNNVGLPPLSQLDPEVLKNLPPEIISEIDDMYKGELHGFLDTLNSNKVKASSSKFLASPAVTQSSVPVDDAKFEGYAGHRDSKYLEDAKGKSVKLSEVKASNDASCSRSSELVLKTAKSGTQLDLMPDSLSQADITVLQELPEDVRADLFNVLPLHRPGDPTSSASDVCEKKVPNDNGADDPKGPTIILPSGSCQQWIQQFRVSSCLILNVIAEQHTDSSSSQPLSSILEPLASFAQLCPSSGTEEWNEALSCLSELLTQYIQLKVETDIEELYKCFCLLKRFGSASVFFLELNNSVLPFLQEALVEVIGDTGSGDEGADEEGERQHERQDERIGAWRPAGSHDQPAPAPATYTHYPSHRKKPVAKCAYQVDTATP